MESGADRQALTLRDQQYVFVRQEILLTMRRNRAPLR